MYLSILNPIKPYIAILRIGVPRSGASGARLEGGATSITMIITNTNINNETHKANNTNNNIRRGDDVTVP